MDRTASNRAIFVLSLIGIGVALYLTMAHLRAFSLACGAAFHGGCEVVAQHPSSRSMGIPAAIQHRLAEGALSGSSLGSAAQALAAFLEGIPTAAYGLGMYALLCVLSFVRVAHPAASRRISRLQWAVCAFSFCFTLWLTYLEAFVIHAWCQWCLLSAAVILLLFIISSAEQLAPPKEWPGEILGRG